MSLISAGSISLDSTFKQCFESRIRIRTQLLSEYRSGTGHRVLMARLQKLEKNSTFLRRKKLQYIYPRFYEGLLNYRRRLQPPKENIQHWETSNFFTVFFVLCVIFAIPEPDPQPQLDPIRIRKSEKLIKRLYTAKWLILFTHRCFKTPD